MKKLIFILILMKFSFGFSQNLVPNPSFEDYTKCPDSTDGQIYLATGWKGYCGSCDYYNTCSLNSEFSVPNNLGGFQYPSTGNAYIGIFTYNLREVLGCQLISPLIIGAEYFVSLKINLAFDPNTFIDFGATNKTGILFSTNQYNVSPNNEFQTNNFAHVYATNIVTDTLNWTTINGSFIADSSYEYLYLGNFFEDAQTDTLTQLQNIFNDNNFCNISYSYLDDIYVSTQPLDLQENQLDSGLKLFPTITDGILNVINLKKIKKIEIINSIGEIVYKIVEVDEEKIKIDISDFQSGIYFVNVYCENNISREKIIVK